jgi:putative aminopeptidase FrvX
MKKTNPEFRLPRIGEAQISLLERLSNACAVSGDEGEVRKIVLEQVRPHADEVKVDALGNVLVTRRGTSEERRLKVMLAAHMDEVGMMITNDEGDGIYRFEHVGGLNAWNLVGKAILIGKEHVPGVIGFKPIHLTDADERKAPVSLEGLRIDTGPVAGKVKIGDRATFATTFARLGPSLRGKALDNRVGVATLIELVHQIPPQIDLLAAFTVQEENGARGARVASYAFDPDLAIVLDTTPAYDQPTWDDTENNLYNTRLGAGPAIYMADAGTLSDPRLVQHLVLTADTYGIPYQIRQPGSGGTDAGAIHKQRAGIPSVSVSVPGRYLHSPASLVRLSDWQHTLTLIAAALLRLKSDFLTSQERP